MPPHVVYTSILTSSCLLSFRLIHEQEIIDMSNGCGENYAVIIVSEQFEGKMTLARHRLGKFLAFLVS